MFPLLDLDCRRSEHLEPVMAELRSANFRPEIVDVPYVFQKGGGPMSPVRRLHRLRFETVQYQGGKYTAHPAIALSHSPNRPDPTPKSA